MGIGLNETCMKLLHFCILLLFIKKVNNQSEKTFSLLYKLWIRYFNIIHKIWNMALSCETIRLSIIKSFIQKNIKNEFLVRQLWFFINWVLKTKTFKMQHWIWLYVVYTVIHTESVTLAAASRIGKHKILSLKTNGEKKRKEKERKQNKTKENKKQTNKQKTFCHQLLL